LWLAVSIVAAGPHLPDLLAQTVERAGIVLDEARAGIPNANLVVRSTQGAVLQHRSTTADGRFTVSGLPAGSYWLEVTAKNFQPTQTLLDFHQRDSGLIEIILGVAPFRSELTITAHRGMVAEIEESTSIITSRDESDFRGRPLPTIGNALAGGTGVMIQQSTYGQVSPFLRGLTGYQVLNLIDGIRLNNSTFRSGPNQYLAFAEPAQVQRIEAILGPASSQFGSDAMGGAIQLLTPVPHFTNSEHPVHGDLNLFGATGDLSGGADARVIVGSKNIAVLVGGTFRRFNDLRAGDGIDSHHVFRRFFGLPDDLIRQIHGSRHQDTGFTQYGLHGKVAARLKNHQSLTLWYQRSDLDGVRGYKDLWGGLGRLRSDFEPQGLQFLYARYEKLSLGPIDSLTGTFSVNSQSDGSIRQGLRASDRIIRDEAGDDASGYVVQAATNVGNRQTIVFGGEIYDERIEASRDETNPISGSIEQKRALYPNGSRYRNYGLFAQDLLEIVRGSDGTRLRANVGARFTRVSFKTFADRNRDAFGRELGVVDASQSYHDWTFNAGLMWQATGMVSLNALVARGFRAPNLNDLGALGLNDLGYEVPAEATIEAGGLIGTSDGEGTPSSGRRVSKLRAERVLNYELGAAFRWRGLYARTQVFDSELKDPIVRRTLVFPIGNAPSHLSDVAVMPIQQTAVQREQGVVSVAPTLDPRAVKAFVNEGHVRYYGLDSLFNYRISMHWSAEGNYSYLVGRELNPNRHVRRLPPQQAYFAIRWVPGNRVSWVEASTEISGAQRRLSGGDLTDERIGAGRRRADIADFFRGTLVSPFIGVGPDGRIGTLDDVFTPTDETLTEIQDRVLPIGAIVNGVRVVDDNSRAPLYLQTPAFASLNLRAGIVVRENVRLNLALLNVLDRNYRIHGSGVDATGISFFAALKFSF
jgi:outer membrane receptor protein involved in Fe transport